jgi:capsular polysaccharide biosynthesis protein
MKIEPYLSILQKGWWIIISMILVSSGIWLAYSYSQIPKYEATATFVVNPSARIADTYDLLSSLDTLAGRTGLPTTYANILQSQIVIDQAVSSLNLPPAILSDYQIKAVVLPDSSILSLQIQGPSPVLVADLANAIGTAGLDFVSELQEIYEIRRLDMAVAPDEPISPNHVTNIALSGIIGLAGGIGFVILRQLLMQSLNEPAQSETSPTKVALPGLNDAETQDVKNVGNKTALQTNFVPSQRD